MAWTMDLGAVKGAEGKSAYQYAQDGGYTGTEAEFQALMAEIVGGDFATMDEVNTAIQTAIGNAIGGSY